MSLAVVLFTTLNMDTSTITAVGFLVIWNVMLALRLHRIERFLYEVSLCDECKCKDATPDASSSGNPSL